MKYLYTLLGVGAFIVLFFAFSGGVFTPGLNFKMSVTSIGSNPIDGNGEVIEEVRKIAPFSKIKVSTAINVVLEKGDTTKAVVISDSNLLDRIKTEVVADELRLYIDKGIKNYNELKVLVTYTELTSLRTSSASKIYAKNRITAETLHVQTSSASSVVLDSLFVNNLNVESSSASSVKIAGEGKKLVVKASSASKIKLQDFIAEDCKANTSSASIVKVFSSNSLNAKAGTGSQIHYYGKPLSIEVRKSSGGSIKAE